jgi:putative membrane protein
MKNFTAVHIGHRISIEKKEPCENIFCILPKQFRFMKLIVARILISAVSILFLGWLLPGVEVSSSWQAIIAALVLALVNAFIRPILIILTLPVTVVTLGLFLFVINACMVLLVDRWLDGFKVDGFWWALLFSLLLAIVNSWLQGFLLKGHEEKK